MIPDLGAVIEALRLPTGTPGTIEPAGRGAWRVTLGNDHGRSVIVRRDPDAERAATHAWTMERLEAAGFAAKPRLLGITGDMTVEEDVPGWSALAVQPPEGSLEAAIKALAAFHALDVGTGEVIDRLQLLPEEETPLFRLGFSAAERQPAQGRLREARVVLRGTVTGPALCYATAEKLLLAPRRAWLVDFGQAGPGLQLFDLAAFLVTSGAGPAERRELAAVYASLRDMPPDAIADIIDLASLAWGISYELELPRRQIQAMGDDPAMEQLLLTSARANRALRKGAGHHPLAGAIRAALWPS